MSFSVMCKRLAADETGAVTVDWVVLVAALCGITLAIMGTINTGLTSASSDISNSITGAITQ